MQPQLTVEDMPPHLRRFDAADWGWAGPQFDVDGLLVPGYRQAWYRFLAERLAWCDANPNDDGIEDTFRRHPDEPWGLWAL
jgi:hypothetical protein